MEPLHGVDWKGWGVNVPRSEPQPKRVGWWQMCSVESSEKQILRRFKRHVEEIL